MNVKVVIDPQGGVTLITQEGTFDDGVEKITALLERLHASGLDVQQVGAPEQHRHGPDGAHVHAHQHQHTH